MHRLAQVVAGGSQEARLGAVGRLGGIARGAHVLQRDAQRLTLACDAILQAGVDPLQRLRGVHKTVDQHPARPGQ